MNDSKGSNVTRCLAGFIMEEAGTLLFLVITISFVVGANDFTGKGATFPLLAGYITLGLIALEIASRVYAFLKNKGGSTGSANLSYRLFLALLFFLGIIASIYALGITLGAVIGVSCYYIIHEKMRLYIGVSLGVATGVSAWLIFEKLAGFSLFSGALF